MKLYGKKYLRNTIADRLESRSETRDAILHEVNYATKICRVKIQGSDKLINAYYPDNWEKTPSWMKVGNAIKILHTAGIRGRIEVIGNGTLRPTPASGSSDLVLSLNPNCIISGCQIFPLYDNPQMAVLVSVGTYRINDVIYTLGPIACTSEVYNMSMGGTIDKVAGVFLVPAASPNFSRIDIIEVGEDGQLHYLTGTASASPVEPSVDTDHVKVTNRLLVYPGTTQIWTDNLNDTVDPTPKAMRLTCTCDPSELYDLNTEATISVVVYDQFGSVYGAWHKIEATLSEGNATLTGDAGSSGTTAIRYGLFSSTTFHLSITNTSEACTARVSVTLQLADITLGAAVSVPYFPTPPPEG